MGCKIRVAQSRRSGADLKALINIWRQVLLGRRFGARSLVAGLLLVPLWQLYQRLIGLPVVITTYRGTDFLLECDCVTSSRFFYEALGGARAAINGEGG